MSKTILRVKKSSLFALRLQYGMLLQKGGALPPGCIRNWGGKEYVGPGDWRLRVQGRKYEVQNNISETDAEKVLSNSDLRKVCFGYARQHFQGKRFINKATGREIVVSKDGLGEWKSKSKSREQILSVKILDGLLENGIFGHNAEDKQGRKNIEEISYFNSKCMINNIEYNAVITVRKIKNYGDKYYHHYLKDIEIEPRSGMTRPAGETG
jgi:hypothetical protein